MLEIEPGELQAEYRPALTSAGREGREAEIYLYDTLPGGAGFARRVGNLGIPLFQNALDILEKCPERCENSCYRCLRSYKNKFEHELLDRHIGVSLLKFLIDGSYPTMDQARLETSTNLLFEDLRRQDIRGLTVKGNHEIDIPGIGSVVAPIHVRQASGSEVIICLNAPLTPDDPADDKLRDVKEYCTSTPVIVCDELAVRLNLPTVTSNLISRLG